MNDSKKILSDSEKVTLETGLRLGELCSGGELILLKGPMGSGKSVLARGIARGLGVTGAVRSPSFNLMREYKGRMIFRHWDLYRLEAGFRELGILESIEDLTVVVVEWAERWADLDAHADFIITMAYGSSETERIIEFAGSDRGNIEN